MTYASVQDIRDRGVDETAANDAAVEQALARALVIIDAYCVRDFLKREETYKLDGTGKASLFLDDRPVIEVSELKVDGQIVQPESFVLYNDAGYIRLNDGLSIFAYRSGVFPKGAQNIEVHGFFGYEEPPAEVKEACILLALAILRSKQEEANVSESQANTTAKAIGIKRVRIDDLSVEYEYPREVAVGAEKKRTTGLLEADRLLVRYRRDLEAMVI